MYVADIIMKPASGATAKLTFAERLTMWETLTTRCEVSEELLVMITRA